MVAFVFGILTIVIAFLLLYPLFGFNQVAYIFTFSSILVAYILFFIPMFIAPFRGDAGGIAVSGGLYYKGLSIYIFVSIVDIVLAFMLMPFALYIIIQCIALFVFLLWVFMAQLAKEHIDGSLQAEEAKKSLIMELRNRSSKLIALTSTLENDNPNLINAKKIQENMRFLSPSDNPEARELDRRLLTALNNIISDPLLASSEGAQSDSLKRKFDEFDVLYRERKSIL